VSLHAPLSSLLSRSAETREALCERLELECLRSSLDCLLVALPPKESWYALTVAPLSAEASSSVPPVASAAAAPAVESSTSWGSPWSFGPGLSGFLAPGSVPVVAAAVLLAHCPAEQTGAPMRFPVAELLALPLSFQDAEAAKKSCVLWERALCALSLWAEQPPLGSAPSAAAGPAAAELAGASAALLSSAAQFFAAALEALVLGRSFVASVEWDLLSASTAIVSHCLLGGPASYAGPLLPLPVPVACASGPGGSPQHFFAAGRHAPLSSAPHGVLLSLPGASEASVAACLQKMGSAVSEKERRASLRAFLESVARGVSPEAFGVSAPTTTSVRPAAPAVGNLKQRLQRPGREGSLGLGSSAVVVSRSLLDTEDAHLPF
jgi:hypothetical protein